MLGSSRLRQDRTILRRGRGLEDMMEKCSECGYPCTETEYHPYEYCVLVKAGIDPEEFIQREINRIAADLPEEQHLATR